MCRRIAALSLSCASSSAATASPRRAPTPKCARSRCASSFSRETPCSSATGRMPGRCTRRPAPPSAEKPASLRCRRRPAKRRRRPWAAGISASPAFSDVPEQARAFVAYVTSRRGQKAMVLRLGWNPGRQDLYGDPQILQALPLSGGAGEGLPPRPPPPDGPLVPADVGHRPAPHQCRPGRQRRRLARPCAPPRGRSPPFWRVTGWTRRGDAVRRISGGEAEARTAAGFLRRC